MKYSIFGCLQNFCVLALLLFVLFLEVTAQNDLPSAPFDVLHYDAQVEPDIAGKTISGKVLIQFTVLNNNLSAVEFDCGNLVVDSVRDENNEDLKFEVLNKRVKAILARPAQSNETLKLTFKYHGTPSFGVNFFPTENQVYTVFSTSQWLICVDAPDDRATLRLNLILSQNLKVVANGRLLKTRHLSHDKTLFVWEEKNPVSSYVFGFAAGDFREALESYGKIRLRYLASSFSEAELKRIFKDTADMIEFYEKIAGVPYPDLVYTQILAAGDPAQEMSGFTVMGEDYGRGILKDERENWLAVHELAHQWWGNKVTCRDWRHFWLNEGMANFMVAAYKEHRFGRDAYLKEIEDLRAGYEKVKNAGKDKSLVFPDWNKPSRQDRTLVYDKGGYVLHLLREELGDEDFWRAIKIYTQKYYGKPVTTKDFQTSVEQTTGKDLSNFFAKWIYLNKQRD